MVYVLATTLQTGLAAGAKVKHVRVLENGDASPTEQHSALVTRATGRFYTPEVVGKHLVRGMRNAVRNRPAAGPVVTIVDPFCGDGRLPAWLLSALAADEHGVGIRYVVELWDRDEDALKSAKRAVTHVARALGVNALVRPVLCDSFEHAPTRFGQFDFVITNPPWDVLKPDVRELRTLKRREACEYVSQMRGQADRLATLYGTSMPAKRYSGWGVNLARCGTELAFRLARERGVVGIVSPATLLADQVSSGLRRWLISNFRVRDLAYFPAEARLFKGVDQPSATVIATSDDPGGFAPLLTAYDRDCRPHSVLSLSVSRSRLEASGFAIPLQFGGDYWELMARLESLPTFGDLERDGELWAGRELDETRSHDYLAEHGSYLFIKGRMVTRFEIAEAPTLGVRRDGPRVPPSADHTRVAWRDVARPTQARRMHAALIPAGWVTGNSLSVAYFHKEDPRRLKALLAIINSLAFEFQVRARSATAHVPLGVVRHTRIPALVDPGIVQDLARLSERCMRKGRGAFVDLEVHVSQLFGFGQDEMSTLLSFFPKIADGERDLLLSHSSWSHHVAGHAR